jgi:mRNA-degrading endonuclease RelE of RelBE toxin-antitoxin system
LSFEKEVLLASPPEQLRLLREKAHAAVNAEQDGKEYAEALYSDLGYAALAADPALGLLIARGVLPVCGEVNQPTLIEDIEDARDLLGLDYHEPGYDILEAADQSQMDQARHAADLEKARAENATRVSKRDMAIQQLKSQIEAMQETLAKREVAIRKAQQNQPASTAPQASEPEAAETRELREKLRRLKDNLKVEHEERNRAMRDLRSAKEQLSRATRAKSENPVPQSPAAGQPADEASQSIDIDWEGQSLRIPEYTPAFRDALRKHPQQASAAAITAAGRLAAGDPSIWKTVRALKLRPGTLRVRVAGDYRLLFEIESPDTLRVVDLILRRDLDRWLAP